MNRIRLTLMAGRPLLGLAIGGWSAKPLIDSYEPPQPEPIVVEPPLVRVTPAERTDLTQQVRAEGTVAPRTALREGNVIFSVDRRRRLRFREVTPLRAGRDVVPSKDGLEEGEPIGLSSMEAVVNGMTVRTTAEGALERDAGSSGARK